MQEEKEFPRGQLNPIILSTLVDKDKYGYEIIEEIKQKTGIEIKQPSLYSSLKRMEAQKYVSSYWQDSAIGGKRHYYCLTAIGKDFLERNPIDFSVYEPSEIKPSEKSQGDKIEPKFAQQDNIFKTLKKESAEKAETIQEEEKPKDFVQYDLFANIKQEEKEEAKSAELTRHRNLHSKSSSDPYQLKYLSEDELKNELERLRNQKFSSGQTVSTASQPMENKWLNRNTFMSEVSSSPSFANMKKEERDEVPTQNDVSSTPSLASEKPEHSTIKEERGDASEVSSVKNDAVYVTERINLDEIPKSKPFTPAAWNIESNTYPSYLRAKLTERGMFDGDKEKYEQKASETSAKKDNGYQRENYSKSLEKLEKKIENFSSNKNPQFDKVDNAYERTNSNNTIFNSYKALESYYNSKGIGLYSYNKKEKTESQYVSYSLIKFARSILFSLFSIILALLFYLTIDSPNLFVVSYIVIPVFSLIVAGFDAYAYYKSKTSTIIQVKKSELSPIILPLISACGILVIIAINLIIGFRHGFALNYFPILIYPICLTLFIAFIVPLNKLIEVCVLKLRERRNKK